MSGIGSISSKKALTWLAAVVGLVLLVWLIGGVIASLMGFLVKVAIFVGIVIGVVWLAKKFMRSRG